MKFHLTDLYSLGRGKRTDCDLDDNVEDSRTNDGTSANISLNITLTTLIVILPVYNERSYLGEEGANNGNEELGGRTSKGDQRCA